VSYALLKTIHYVLALISVSGFVLRGVLMFTGSPLLQHRITRILPHIVDTLFLMAGLVLAHRIFQYPFTHDWLTAKLFGLIIYIVLGSIALKHGRTPRQRKLAFIAAIVTFAWIISVAMTKSPWGFLQFLAG
jgi:uncharacterized membrane protein SirB2